MARYVMPGVWECQWCRRVLPESEFATDGYRQRTGRGPGKCRDCDREYARAKTAISDNGKFSGADSREAYHLARPTCEAHAWGAGYYSRTDKAAAKERAGGSRWKSQGMRRGVDDGRTLAEAKADEAARQETIERRLVDEYRRLDTAAERRAAAPKQKPARQGGERMELMRDLRAAIKSGDEVGVDEIRERLKAVKR